MESLILAVWEHGFARWRSLRDEPDAGYSTEAALVTALLVIMAIAVLGIITAKVIAKANEIDLGDALALGVFIAGRFG